MTLFGLNARRQCVAISLCALIYNKHWLAITSSVDLTNIMNVGNELYSVLSRLYNQDFLLLIELPNTVTIYSYLILMQDPHAIDCLNMLINYFQNIYDGSDNSTFELRGVLINQEIPTCEPREVPLKNIDNYHENSNNTSNVTNDILVKYCSALSFYCICFSIIKSCSYWKSDTRFYF